MVKLVVCSEYIHLILCTNYIQLQLNHDNFRMLSTHISCQRFNIIYTKVHVIVLHCKNEQVILATFGYTSFNAVLIICFWGITCSFLQCTYILVVLPLTYIIIGGLWIISVIIIKWCKSKMSCFKNTNEDMVNLLDEPVVDHEDISIGWGSSTVLERPVYKREFDNI